MENEQHIYRIEFQQVKCTKVLFNLTQLFSCSRSLCQLHQISHIFCSRIHVNKSNKLLNFCHKQNNQVVGMLHTVLIMNPPTHKVSSSKRISFKFASQHKSQCYKSVKITFISRRSVSEQRQHFSKWLPTEFKLLRIYK